MYCSRCVGRLTMRLFVGAVVCGSDERGVLSSDGGEITRYEFLRNVRSRFPRGLVVVLPVDVEFEYAVADSVFRYAVNDIRGSSSDFVREVVGTRCCGGGVSGWCGVNDAVCADAFDESVSVDVDGALIVK